MRARAACIVYTVRFPHAGAVAAAKVHRAYFRGTCDARKIRGLIRQQPSHAASCTRRYVRAGPCLDCYGLAYAPYLALVCCLGVVKFLNFSNLFDHPGKIWLWGARMKETRFAVGRALSRVEL